ncbi:MAG: extracellular solute-binding protein [Campylobacterales bacterium]|nr:extracellular solute-binding protein [Campylobacterales bacterium]
MKYLILILAIALSLFGSDKTHALTLGGSIKYKEGFTHFDYVNPKMKKGGILKSYAIGTFDSLNPFLLKGKSAVGIVLTYDTLMTSSLDEEFTYYGLIAKSAKVAKDNSFVIFYINKKAKFHDGKPITAEDVKFSFETLTTKGTPFYKRYYKEVKEAIVIDKYTVKFTFKNKENLELPVILGQLKVLPKHFWKNKNFSHSSNIKPLGSGPYRLKSYKYGKYVEYERVKDYWAKDLNVNKGLYNFGKIKYDYYKDQNVALEAFLAGEYSLRLEGTAKNWATLYKGDNFKKEKILKKEIYNASIGKMQGLIFNLREKKFENRDVRKAISLLFDFQWTNKNLFYSQYKRTESFFENSQLKATGLPSKDELKLLNQIKEHIPQEVFTTVFKTSVTKGDGKIRNQLRQALRLFKKAGYSLKKGKLVDKKGKQLSFEIILASATFNRILLPFKKNLAQVGVRLDIKTIDRVQYINRLQNYKYDMTLRPYRMSTSPGNELYGYFSSKYADTVGGRNYSGIQNKGVDFLVEKIVKAKNRKDLITGAKALDRVLLHSHMLIPNWYIDTFRVAHWNYFIIPKNKPKYSYGLFTWGIDEKKQKSLIEK